ncbi:serine carboxypeptidase s28 domain-containing protein [Ditylenchus destructor]|uniref:Serine carboxypeptidase s28 domain-containing protein n=1 Tax=Ditylenchus destructor TaxID=166010 RepID=A0AAD4NAW2_9BILA|nr:serine carboxypeptidase s28 domain-containing protein [Ditylenchus destructor]
MWFGLWSFTVLLSLCGCALCSDDTELFLRFSSLTRIGPNALKRTDDVSTGDAVENTVDQLVDHFNPSSTFKQRYFVNTKYANGSEIHFLVVEGQGAADPSKITNANITYVNTAKDVGATLWLLEHRFYGKSWPASTSSVDNLATLNIQQAVEDIANFIKIQNDAHGEKNPKWVVIGSFYAGTLALWLRQQKPSLTVGVVSSSAPSQPALNFYLYHKNVEDAYGTYSKTCAENLANVILNVRQLVQSAKGREQLSSTLQLTPDLNSLQLRFPDYQFFFIVLSHLFRIPAQYNKVNVGPFATSGGIVDVCNILADKTVSNLNKVGRLANTLFPLMTGSDKFNGLMSNHSLFTELLQNESPDAYAATLRATLWQDCNELGFFQTTDYGGLAFGSSIPNNFYLNLCTDVFGDDYEVNNLKKGIKKLRPYTSSFVYQGSNAVLTHGSQDPWRTLGYNTTSDKTSIFLSIPGAAHSADLAPRATNDSFFVNRARGTISNNIRKWLTGTTSSKASRSSFNRHNRLPEKSEADALPKSRVIKNWDAKLTHNLPKPDVNEALAQTNSSMNLFRLLSFRHHFNVRMAEKVANADKKLVETHERYTTYHSIEQDLDHFDTSVTDKWTQYYYYNDIHETTGGPIFLHLGGEGPINSYYVGWILSLYNWAQNFGASIYALEHRFYGKSQPKEDVSVENLKWLKSEQALADAAVFVKAINKARDLTNTKWIVFGGSYPGNLAAWFRFKYPDLVYGAIASSAPVLAKVDFFEYLQVVSNSTIAYGIDNCPKNVHRFFIWAQQQTTTIAGRKDLSHKMGLCDKWDQDYVDDKDIELILAFFVFDIAGMVQYDSQGHSYVHYICEVYKEIDKFVGADVHIDGESERTEAGYWKVVEGIGQRMRSRGILRPKANGKRKVVKGGVKADDDDGTKCPDYQNYGYDQDCQDSNSDEYDDSDFFCEGLSYEAYVDILQQVTPYDTSDRCWFWQTCNELGVFQSTNMGYNLFESTLPVNFQVDFCRDVFGAIYTRDYIDSNIRYTNGQYGGNENFNATRVVFVNGSEDPWHVNSVLESDKSKDITAILIDGTSHCEDMYEEESSDKEVLKKARKQIKRVLEDWL